MGKTFTKEDTKFYKAQKKLYEDTLNLLKGYRAYIMTLDESEMSNAVDKMYEKELANNEKLINSTEAVLAITSFTADIAEMVADIEDKREEKEDEQDVL